MRHFVALLSTLLLALPAAATPALFKPADLFQLQWAADAQISPDGKRVVYVRTRPDIMTDRYRQELWMVTADGSGHQPLATERGNHGSPRWSPDGTRIAYVGSDDGSTQLYVRWADSGREARVAQLPFAPSSIEWSPDGEWLAYSAFVPETPESFVTMPAAPKGAEWAERARYIDSLTYRFDGRGFLQTGNSHVFVVPAQGGAPRQLTQGPYDHRGELSWFPDGSALVLSANRSEDPDFMPRESDVYRVDIATGALTRLTDRSGPDAAPRVSPNGRHIAYVGFDDDAQSYQQSSLYVMDADGGNRRVLTADLDRSVGSLEWAANSRGVYFEYVDQGTTKVGYADLSGRVREVVAGLAGASIGRPYSGGSFSVADNGQIAFSQGHPQRPPEVAIANTRGSVTRLTKLNDGLLTARTLGEVEEIWFESSHDDRKIHGWIIKPPGFDPARKYPLVLEIHGGPFASYGPSFAVELQAYAAAGYVVLYTNPRGSTSYGQEFASLIHHNYPGEDHDDLMSGVDAVIARGYVDAERLYITGGSGGGVLTAWAIGMTERFRAAVVQKPVINWYSFAFVTDIPITATRYWFGAMPWENAEEFLRRSPISLVANVSTPTMVLTGESDYRTPMSESEQYYQALKLRGIDAALVRIPGAPHNIGHRPSNMIDQVLHIIAWFDKHP